MAGELKELTAFCQTVKELKAMVGGLVEEKRRGAAGSSLAVPARGCVLKVAELRKVNRDAHEAADRVIAKTEAARAETDIVSQQLQNLQYQKIHLSRELQMCLAYRGVEDLELLSEAEFEECTPADQRGGARGSHAYELARLTCEMKKREEMIKTVKQQDLRRKLYQGKLEGQRKFLESLQGHLENVHAAAAPVRKEFTKQGPLPSLDAGAAAAAQMLPAPLYAIYYQAHAYAVNFGEEAAVTIAGDVAAAQNFFKTQALVPATPQKAGEDSKKRRKRKGDEREEDKRGEDVTAAHPLTVNIKIAPAAGSKAPTLSLVFSYLHVLQVVTVKHSLSAGPGTAEQGALLQDLFPDDSGELAPLVSADYLLAHLGAKRPSMHFSDSSTHGRAYKWAQRVAGLRYPPRDPGAAAGALDAAAASQAEGGDGAKADGGERAALDPLAYGTLVAKLRQRVEVSFQVKAIVTELGDLARAAKGGGMALPQVPGAQELPAYGAVVTGWAEVTKEVLAAQAAALGLDDDMEIERERRENERELRAADAGEEEGEVAAAADPVPKSVLHSTEKQAAQVARRGHRFFRATLSKSLPAGGGTWLVQADVEVAAGYPKAPPVWRLKLMQRGAQKQHGAKMPGADPAALAAASAARTKGEETDSQLRSIEAEVNHYAASQVRPACTARCEACQPAILRLTRACLCAASVQARAHGCPEAQLLAYQLLVAVHCYGMYVDAESGTAALPTSREHRGRDRRLPFLWNAAAHSFEQRT